MSQNKLCSKCLTPYPLTTEYFYPARKLDRNRTGWQSYCKGCWKDINLANKIRRKDIHKDKDVINEYFKAVRV